jgi:extracellular elastinolytic metalloproteinase
VDELLVTDAYQDAHNGVTHVYLRQAFEGVPVADANMTVNVGRDGGVISSPHHFIRNLGAAASGVVELGAVASANAAADELGLRPTEPIRVVEGSAGPARELVLSDGGIAESSIPAKLVFQALPSGKARLAWQLEIEEASGEHFWSTSVDAVTGELLDTEDYVVDDPVEATALAIARPQGSQAASARLPSGRLRP